MLEQSQPGRGLGAARCALLGVTTAETTLEQVRLSLGRELGAEIW
jgi:hypothetical protein